MIHLVRETPEDRELGGDLGTSDDRHQGTPGFRKRRTQGVEFLREKRTGTGYGGKAGDALGRRFGAMGGGEASITNTSQSFAIFRASSSEFFFSPLLARQLSSSTARPGRMVIGSKPSTQFCTSGTSVPSNSESPLCDRRQRILGPKLALGRPAQVRSHHDPRTRCKSVANGGKRGADARVLGNTAALVEGHVEILADEDPLVLEVEISESDEAHRPTGAHQGPRHFAFINATVASSMRLLKPHSLSYQASTLTSVPPVTLVSDASKVLEAGS